MAPNPETDDTDTTTVDETAATSESATNAADGVEVQSPDFQAMSPGGDKQKQNEISRFADIKVAVAAELGRTSINIEKLISLGPGSVIELNRSIDSPIELTAQGIPLASGEVVVVDNCFAVRILEVYPRNRKGEELKVEKKA